ncbi:DNA double-strand break repair nuclease NurA [Tepidiphilus olei]|uniref:DNA double-strand break repair nuclease NurA n=1 Tax=Tepidiphilus olei TaxID=2502184 RepID=UPI00115CB3CB|nr:DNA double-strand break repair nuclease NurA [Tepidiphilus olei]
MSDTGPFAELPAALVDEVLAATSEVAGRLLASFSRTKEQRANFRKSLEDSGLLLRKSDLGSPPYPTTCATDGSYAIERLLTTDLVAAAAVAVEGLTPPSETRHWAYPRHTAFIEAEPHHEGTSTILRALMLGRELELALAAPHDLILLDGTLTLPVIYFNQALNAAPDAPELKTAGEFLGNIENFFSAYHDLLTLTRNDKQIVSLPKYSTRREIGRRLGWPDNQDDRGLLTLVLNPGELTKPVQLETPSQAWHFNTSRIGSGVRNRIDTLGKEIVAALDRVHVFYYKPQSWLPALRVEVAASIANNPHRLGIVVQGLEMQCATPAMLEPYPNYLADRTVKALAKALPAFRQVTTQRIAEEFKGDIGEVFFAMHGYRSDSGRK